MKKIMIATFALGLMSSLVACGSTHRDLTAPCHDFGRYCPQTPINH